MATEETLKISIVGENKSALTAYAQVETGMNKVAVSANKTSAAMQATGVAVNKNSQTWQNFGRVIQDLPYGFNGIANNLTQLIPSVGALGLAFSGVVTAITFAQIGFSNWTRGIGSGKKQVDDYISVLGSLNEVQKEANKQAGEEITNLKYTYAAANDVTLSMKERLRAANQLKDQYPELLKGITAENIANGQAIGIYDKLTQSILQNARAKAASAKISELEAQKLDILYNKEKILAVTGKELKELRENAKDEVINAGGQSIRYSKQQQILQGTYEIEKRRNDALKIQEDLLSRIASQQLFLEKAVGKTNLEKTTIGNPEKKKEQKETLDYYDKLGIAIGIMVQNQKEWETVNKGKGQTVGTPAPVPSPGFAPQNLSEGNRLGDYLQQLEDLDKAQQKEKEHLEQMGALANIAADAFGNLFDKMAQGQNLGDALGEVFKDLAKQIAVAAIKSFIFATILNILTGGASSIGKVVLSGLLGSLSGGSKGYAGGGVATGPTSGYPAILHGTEHIMQPGQLKSIVAGAAQIGSMQGSGGGEYLPRQELRGDTLLLWYERAGYNANLTR